MQSWCRRIAIRTVYRIHYTSNSSKLCYKNIACMHMLLYTKCRRWDGQSCTVCTVGNHEVIWLSLRLHCGRKVVVCAAYRPGSSADDDISLLEHIDTMIPRLRHHGTQIIIAGDFNVHNRAWICSNRTTTAGEFAEDVCLDHGLQQHVVVPTRGSNTLDLVMSDFAHTPAMHYLPPLRKIRSLYCGG